MSFSEAVTDVLRDEVARTSRYAVSRRTAVAPTTILHWLREDRVHVWVDVVDAAVATYGLARIAAHLDPADRAALYGVCIDCGERPKAMRGLLRRCKSCIRARKAAA
jgi:hypothetical protein